MENLDYLFQKYLDEKVEIAFHTVKMNNVYSSMMDEIDDRMQLDDLCVKELKKLQRQYDESVFEASIAQCDFIPNVPVWKAKMMLKDAAELVLHLNEYKPLPRSFMIARDIYAKQESI